ncbi:hypothetical protein [Mycolicibacterium phlei]|uniref:hypothetical protein n=1 Tax=Mycolicibacterium phlei TaxID=1771 RepID=UPI0005913C73|nr:hypothetical protein [Mycolicibacterium phlei]MBF4194565.1 hypothetical protein [Mycolicibacterium phlei]
MTYTVYFKTGASHVVTGVEAEDPEEAIETAWRDAGEPILCHHCAEKLELGEDWEPALVFDDDTNELAWEA